MRDEADQEAGAAPRSARGFLIREQTSPSQSTSRLARGWHSSLSRLASGVFTLLPLSSGEPTHARRTEAMSIDELTAAVLDLPPQQRGALIEKV